MPHEQPRRRLMALRPHDNKHRQLIDDIHHVRLRRPLRRPQRPALIDNDDRARPTLRDLTELQMGQVWKVTH